MRTAVLDQGDDGQWNACVPRAAWSQNHSSGWVKGEGEMSLHIENRETILAGQVGSSDYQVKPYLK